MVDEILVEETKKVYFITLNRPEKLNAINFNMMRQIEKCLIEAEENENIQLVVFKGAKCRAFSTGFDTQQILTMSTEKKTKFWEMNLKVSELSLTSEKLSMSLIRGFAVAAGFAFCLFTDFRVAEDNPDIYFALPEISLGIFPYSVLALTSYYLPPSIALSIIFGGDKLTLTKADELGLIHRRYSSDLFEKSTKKYIRSITSQNTKVQRMAKICYNNERKNILKNMHIEEDFTQACLDPELLTQEKIMEIKRKWGKNA
jgi:enoyl-CoA hydratase/carnithine racemase